MVGRAKTHRNSVKYTDSCCSRIRTQCLWPTGADECSTLGRRNKHAAKVHLRRAGGGCAYVVPVAGAADFIFQFARLEEVCACFAADGEGGRERWEECRATRRGADRDAIACPYTVVPLTTTTFVNKLC